MISLVTQIKRMDIEAGKRILVTSDIHGYLSRLENVLNKARFSENDILFIVGDMIERGPDSLGTLRYIMKLCCRGNVIPLIGNVDAYRLKIIQELDEENVVDFFNYNMTLRNKTGTSFYCELASECGCRIDSPKDILRSKEDVLSRFYEEFAFLASLPTVVEAGNYVFVHGGLREKHVSDNKSKGVFELTKYDAFAESTPYSFDKYVVVGHWPVSLYNDSVQQLDPIIDRVKRIISIDGGCGVQREGQLNLLILPDINCTVDEITHIACDENPCVRAAEDQAEGECSIYISWVNRKIRMIKAGEEFSFVEHIQSGRRLSIPNSYLKNEAECSNYTDYILPVKAGDRLSLISKNSKGCIVKKGGVVGWYFGKTEDDN